MELTDKKILVTGGNGFLGKNLVAALQARGVAPENIVIPNASECDLRILKNCEEVVKGIDVVFHLAGVTGGITYHLENPGSIAFDNIMMGAQLMESARKAGVQKFLTAGSVTEYPMNAPIPYNEDDLWIGAPFPTHFAYSAAKTMLLVQAQAYRAQYGFNAVHLLLTNMYGPGEPWKGDSVIQSTICRMYEAIEQKSSTFEVWGSGKPTRDFLYVEDAAAAFIAAAERYDKSEPVNIATGKEVSISELVTTIAKLMNFNGEIIYNTEKPDGQPRRFMDCSKAMHEFGFAVDSDLQANLQKTVTWALANREA